MRKGDDDELRQKEKMKKRGVKSQLQLYFLFSATTLVVLNPFQPEKSGEKLMDLDIWFMIMGDEGVMRGQVQHHQ